MGWGREMGSGDGIWDRIMLVTRLMGCEHANETGTLRTQDNILAQHNCNRFHVLEGLGTIWGILVIFPHHPSLYSQVDREPP